MSKRHLSISEIKNVIKWRIRNSLIDPWYIVYWDMLPKLRRELSYDKGDDCYARNHSTIEIPIVITTYRRPFYLKRTLESFFKWNVNNASQFVIIILLQGDKDEDTESVLREHKTKINRIIRQGVNLGCARGYSFLMGEIAKEDWPYVVYLQDDFESNDSLSQYLSELIHLLESEREIGCIRLRSIRDSVNPYNIISRRKMRYKRTIGNVAIGNGHFTFNPTIARTAVVKEIIPVSSEKDAMKKYQKLGLKTGQLLSNCFIHIGRERIKDWVK